MSVWWLFLDEIHFWIGKTICSPGFSGAYTGGLSRILKRRVGEVGEVENLLSVWQSERKGKSLLQQDLSHQLSWSSCLQTCTDLTAPVRFQHLLWNQITTLPSISSLSDHSSDVGITDTPKLWEPVLRNKSFLSSIWIQLAILVHRQVVKFQ